MGRKGWWHSRFLFWRLIVHSSSSAPQMRPHCCTNLIDFGDTILVMRLCGCDFAGALAGARLVFQEDAYLFDCWICWIQFSSVLFPCRNNATENSSLGPGSDRRMELNKQPQPIPTRHRHFVSLPTDQNYGVGLTSGFGRVGCQVHQP